MRKILAALATVAVAIGLAPGVAMACQPVDESEIQSVIAGQMDDPTATNESADLTAGTDEASTDAATGADLLTTNASATAALDQLKTQQYYTPGGACPSGTNVGWLRNGSYNCQAECYAFAAGVCEHLFGSAPSGVMTYGYKCTNLNGFSCLASLVCPSYDEVVAAMKKASPGDWLQMAGGPSGWGAWLHSAIIESVDDNGVRIYQHGDRDHITSTYMTWEYFYYTYTDLDGRNSTYTTGMSIYHADNYDSLYSSDATGPTITGLQAFEVGLRDGQFTLIAFPSASSGISSVKFATWTAVNDQDDLVWYEGSRRSDGAYYCYVPYSDHGSELGTYITHCYAYDAYGNESIAALTYYIADTNSGLTCVSFPDVQDYSEWFYDSAVRSAARGLISGYGDGTFGPSSPLTRAQAATILWRYYQPAAAASYDGSATNNTGMSDVVSGQWYTAAANWAVSAGVINGKKINGSLYFDPEGPITREQLCTIIANASHAYAGSAITGGDDLLAAFPDADQSSSWARSSLAWGLKSGVIKGKGSNTGRILDPLGTVSRAEMAAILMNSLDAHLLG